MLCIRMCIIFNHYDSFVTTKFCLNSIRQYGKLKITPNYSVTFFFSFFNNNFNVNCIHLHINDFLLRYTNPLPKLYPELVFLFFFRLFSTSLFLFFLSSVFCKKIKKINKILIRVHRVV